MERLIAAEKGEPIKDTSFDEPPPPRHEVNYVIRTWLNHRRHGTYPAPGGYDDQDADLMEDWHTLNLYHMRIENGVYAHLAMPADAPDISAQLGE